MAGTGRRPAVLLTTLTALVVGTGTVGAGAAVAAADHPTGPVPVLDWADCGTTPEGTAAGVRCATADLPMDYDEPRGAQVHIAVAEVPATDPAHRIGSLFIDVGGLGETSVDHLRAVGAGDLAALNERFDIVGFDPRGVGRSRPAIDCHADQETEGPHRLPVPTPLDVDADAQVARALKYVHACLADGEVLEHVSTANVARDLDALRAAVGEDRLTYLGSSSGTFLGATYAALFPGRYRAMVLDGPIDAQQHIEDPMGAVAEQASGSERALGRFTEACARDQVACSGFGGASPSAAYDALVAAAETHPVPAPGYAADPRPVTGDDIRTATRSLLDAKQLWGVLGAALAQAAAGDGSTIRAVADASSGRQVDGTSDPTGDRSFTIGASEQQYPHGDLSVYLDRGAESWASFPHFWSTSGYAEIGYALWPAHDRDAFAGPFTVPAHAVTPLVIGTTYDPATPYPGARRLVAEEGNARLLTMVGDGHTAYRRGSPCIDAATEAYLVGATLPPAGTVCTQEVPFAAPEPAGAGTSALPGRAPGTGPRR